MGGDRYRNKDTCNDDKRDVVIRPASVPWLVNNMMVIVNCCVGGHCYFSPSRDDGHVFDRANHLFFWPVANNVVLFVVVFSQLVGLVPA